MGNFVLRKDPIHFLLGCLILISLSESEFRVISDQVLLCQNNRKCQAARTAMANLIWRHYENRNEGSALNSLNFFFFCKYLQRIYTQAPCRLLWKCSQHVASQASCRKAADNGGNRMMGWIALWRQRCDSQSPFPWRQQQNHQEAPAPFK